MRKIDSQKLQFFYWVIVIVGRAKDSKGKKSVVTP